MTLSNKLALLFPLLLLCFTAQASAQQSQQRQQPDDVIRIESTLVSIPVTVSDRNGRYLSGLKAADFALYSDGVKQPIAFFSAEQEAFHVALLLDTSRSTQKVLDDIKQHAKNFLRQLRPQDRALIVSFDYDVHKLSALTADRKKLERAIDSARIGEYVGTTLRDAVYEVVSREFKTVTGRKAIILLSDGKDHGSRVSIEELLDTAEESDTMIYSIFYTTGFGNPRLQRELPRRRRFPLAGEARQFPDRRERRRMVNERAVEFLEELSEVSAGRFYENELTDLQQTFAMIADELRHQYRLGFYPDGERGKGISHRLRVTVSRSEAVVRARRSYVD